MEITQSRLHELFDYKDGNLIWKVAKAAKLKVGDIASQFMKAKTSELELSDGEVDIFDPDVQSALSGDKLPGSLDYLMQVRSDPRYRFTKKANEGAAGFLDTLLRMWGKVG